MVRALLAAAAVSAVSVPALADDPASDPNGVYERFAAGFATLDAAALVDGAYTADAIYLRGRDETAAVGRDAILSHYDTMFAGMADAGVTPQLAFRVASRITLSDEAVADTGWYRFETSNADGETSPAAYGRFLTVVVRRDDGLWAFARDLDSTASQALWDAQDAVDGLHYDE